MECNQKNADYICGSRCQQSNQNGRIKFQPVAPGPNKEQKRESDHGRNEIERPFEVLASQFVDVILFFFGGFQTSRFRPFVKLPQSFFRKIVRRLLDESRRKICNCRIFRHRPHFRITSSKIVTLRGNSRNTTSMFVGSMLSF